MSINNYTDGKIMENHVKKITHLQLLIQPRSLVHLAPVILASAIATTQAAAAELYVDAVNGSNVVGCLNIAAPCQTIAHTIGQSVAGDTVNLISTTSTPTTYFESGLTIPHDLTVRGSGVLQSEIDAQNIDRVFSITAGNVLIDNLTIRNGDAGFNSGGNIELLAGSLIVSRSQVLNGIALAGGGIAAHTGAGGVWVIASNIRQNIGTATGGGVWCNDCGGVNAALSAISDNLAGGSGGGIYVENDTATIVKSYMKRNNADTGGAVYMLGGTTTITGSELAHNDADNSNGGAVMASGILNVQLSTLADNTAANEGGAIYATDGSVLLASNSTFSNNEALVGGAFSLNVNFGTGPEVIVGASTFYNNQSTFPGAAEHIFGGWTTFEMYNTIVTSDPAVLIPFDPFCSAPLTDGQHNLIDDASCDGPPATFNLGVVSGFDLGLAFHGGITRTHALLAGSNAIDTGRNAACRNPATGANLVFDQRRKTRPVDGDLNGVATCDIGAFEVQ